MYMYSYGYELFQQFAASFVHYWADEFEDGPSDCCWIIPGTIEDDYFENNQK